MGGKEIDREPSKEQDGLTGLLSALGGKSDVLKGVDPTMLLKAGKAIAQMNGKPDDRCILLGALKPYLRQERQNRVDEAVRILNLMRLAELFRGEIL